MALPTIRNIVILTGAGISAESGLATFRGPDGLWEGHRVEDVATPEAFRARSGAGPRILRRAAGEARRRSSPMRRTRRWRGSTPNGRASCCWSPRMSTICTSAPGSKRLLHMHGELKSGWCLACDERFAWDGPMGEGAACPACEPAGQVRPDIVWFGEMPYEMERIEDALRRCDLFVSIGTSGAVYPAAGFVQTARYCGARTLEINLEPSQGSVFFHESRIGKAGELVPAWVEEVLAELSPPTPARFAVEAAVLVPARVDLDVQEQVDLAAEVLGDRFARRLRRSP